MSADSLSSGRCTNLWKFEFDGRGRRKVGAGRSSRKSWGRADAGKDLANFGRQRRELWRNGVWLPHACCHGLCATCKVQVVEGEFEHGEASSFALMLAGILAKQKSVVWYGDSGVELRPMATAGGGGVHLTYDF